MICYLIFFLHEGTYLLLQTVKRRLYFNADVSRAHFGSKIAHNFVSTFGVLLWSTSGCTFGGTFVGVLGQLNITALQYKMFYLS